MKYQKLLIPVTAAAILCGAVTWSAARNIPIGETTLHVASYTPYDVKQAAIADQTEDTPPAPVSYDEYAPFGLTYDEKTDALYYEGELVRCFFDGVEVEPGAMISRCEYWNKEGTVDLCTVRTAIDNGDGSVNPFGKLIGLEKCADLERNCCVLTPSDGAALECTAVFGPSDPDDVPFADRFAPYVPYGLEYVEAGDRSGFGNLYWNGRSVRALADITPDGGAFSFTSRDGGDISVQTVYDNEGNLIGLKAAE